MDVEKLDLLMHMTLVQYALWLSCISTFETYEKKGYLVECKALDLCLRLTCILADGQKKFVYNLLHSESGNISMSLPTDTGENFRIARRKIINNLCFGKV